jgi:hydrogenase maturation factor
MLEGHFGASSNQIILGPGPGLDAAVLDLSGGRVMAIAEDPIFPAPGLSLDILGWFTVHIGASDVAVTGIRPQFMTYTLLLPPACPESDAETIIVSISKAAEELGISVVGGHTGWYDAVNIPTVGGVTVWGIADHSSWISPAGARDGDIILMTKGPAIEATALLARLYKDKIKDRISGKSVEQLLGRVNQITVVRDALTAFKLGGVHAMHDATEGGVLGGIHEMSFAAGIAAHVDVDGVDVPSDIRDLADALVFDPWQAISEGTLLAAVDPLSVPRIRDAWRNIGIDSYELGRFDRRLGQSTVRRNGKLSDLAEPGVDPFWDLFFAGLRA